MVAEVVNWYNDLNLDGTRVSRPSKFLFLCGGAICNEGRAANLRDYLLRVRPIKTKYDIVLAEEATQLYRDTGYKDLITFEEDIARIAAIVMVIAESSGSLAELGAFSTNDTIMPTLRVIIPKHHESAESFVRYGPIKRLLNVNREYLGVYPWKVYKKGGLNVSSIKPHYTEITNFINGHLDKVPKSTSYNNLKESNLIYVVYWVIHLVGPISPKILYNCVQSIVPDTSNKDIRNKLYCLQLAKWISIESYSDKDYFYALIDDDPFEYSYKEGVVETSAVRRKLAVKEGMKKIEKIPKHVLKIAAEARMGEQ